MRKQPKKLTPLRQVRLASDLTQKDFAARVGIKYDLYQSLELGRVPLTDDNAYRIHLTSGATPESLDHTRSRYARASHEAGAPYSKTSWISWQDDQLPYLDRYAADLSKDLVCWLLFLCRIASEEGKSLKLHAILADALTDAKNACGLSKAVETDLRRRRHSLRLKYTYGELRKNPALAFSLGFKDKDLRKGQTVTNDQVWHKTLIEPVPWDPFGPFPDAWARSIITRLVSRFTAT